MRCMYSIFKLLAHIYTVHIFSSPVHFVTDLHHSTGSWLLDGGGAGKVVKPSTESVILREAQG